MPTGSQAVKQSGVCSLLLLDESADQSEKKTKKVLFDDAGHMTRKCVDIMYVV